MTKKDKLREPLCQQEFERWLSQYWPLWKEPKNRDGIRYFDLKAAYEQGWKDRA